MISASEIKDLARAAGFDCCGIVRARPLTRAEERFRKWLATGNQGSLGYLERNQEKRFDPARLVEGCKSVIVCAINYKNRMSLGYPEGFSAKIASYALNRDYHSTIKALLHQLLSTLKEQYPALSGRSFTDSAPLAEKTLAVEAGLGWIGRNSLLITPRFGSFVLLGELLINDECDAYDTPFAESHCGSCTRCREACPNGAIGPERMIDTRRCIACQTIEQGDPAPDVHFDGWIFGCDHCQSVCPHNQHTPLASHPDFCSPIHPLEFSPDAWQAMNEEEFATTFSHTPLPRAGLGRLKSHFGK